MRKEEEKLVVDFEPFDKCPFERNPATGEMGWHAPKGYAFKIEGKFYVKQRELIREGWRGWATPCPSKDLFVEELGYEDEFKNFLEIAKGDPKKAFRLLIKDIKDWSSSVPTDYIPEFFAGKWIFIEPNPQEGPAKPRLKVVSEAEVYESDEFIEVRIIQSEDTKITTKTAFPPDLVVDYIQQYAEAVLGGCHITLVKKREKKLELVVAKPRPTSIVKPLWSAEVEESKHSEPLKPGDVRF